jgi:hypothetical protein
MPLRSQIVSLTVITRRVERFARSAIRVGVDRRRSRLAGILFCFCIVCAVNLGTNREKESNYQILIPCLAASGTGEKSRI